MPLKYLFTAYYSDGTKYEQNAEDKSVKEPDTRSSYYDIDHDKLVAFVLRGEGHEYGVDLRDGHFEIDGVQFFMHEDNKMKDFRLVFWRRHTHSFNQKVNGETVPVGHEVVYRFGWQATRDGENQQEIMQID